MSLTIDDVQTFVTLLEQNAALRKQVKQVLFPELNIEETLARLTRLLERMDSRVAAQETALVGLRSDLTVFKEKTEQNFVEVRTEIAEVRSDLTAFKEETRQNFVEVRAEIAEVRSDLTAFKEETRQNFVEVRAEIAEVRSDLTTFKEKTEQNFVEVRAEIAELSHDVAGLKGKSQEAFYHRRAAAIFGRYIVNGREVSNRVANRLQTAFEQTLITDEEYDQILAADMLFGGKLRLTGEEVLLVMEASWYAQVEDVQRAVDRAAIGQRGGLSAIPVVGGESWSDEAIALATERAVARTIDGRLDRASWQRAVEVWLSAE